LYGTYLERRGHWHDWVSAQEAAREAARRLRDRTGVASAYRELGHAHARMGRNDDANKLLRHALTLFADLDDPLGQAHCHNNLTLVLEQQGRHAIALTHATSAYTMYRAACAAGDIDTARDAWQDAWRIFDELGHTTEQIDIRLRELDTIETWTST
jgi:tetratricopeptide (TPR) repeat protein